MAIQNEPTRIQIPFADSGTKNVIPDTNPTPSASQAASWTDGFPTQCSLPLASGGIPPARADFNGVFNTMSQSIRFGQEGGVWTWDATVDYAANRLVLGSDGLLYWSVAQSGPNVGGAQDPTTDDGTHWGTPSMPTMPAGDDSQAVATTGFVGAAINNIAIPVGTVLWSAKPAVPSGYLPCNGAAVAKSDYPALFAAIGNTFLPKGVPASPTTFMLPNLMGKVPWGSSSQVGTEMKAGLPNIKGGAAVPNSNGINQWNTIGSRWGAIDTELRDVSVYFTTIGGNNQHTVAGFNLDASRSSSIYGQSSTVQPPALCLLPCIRYE
nr:MAG TPA: tail fiber protein [Caudoviricetes sp.]